VRTITHQLYAWTFAKSGYILNQSCPFKDISQDHACQRHITQTNFLADTRPNLSFKNKISNIEQYRHILHGIKSKKLLRKADFIDFKSVHTWTSARRERLGHVWEKIFSKIPRVASRAFTRAHTKFLALWSSKFEFLPNRKIVFWNLY
jgi:hypothetical protein